MIIIPELLPTTKVYDLYGPEFNYSLQGDAISNPILVPSPLSGTPNPAYYRIRLFVGINVLATTTVSQTQIDIKLYCTDGSVYRFSQYRPRTLSSGLSYYPCGTSLYVTYLGSDVDAIMGAEINIFRLLRDGKSVSNIEVSVNSTLALGNITPLMVRWGFIGGSRSVTYAQFVYNIAFNFDTSIVYNACVTSLGPNKKTITLNKSTGFVLTVT